MRVHPAPKKRNITYRYDINPGLSEAVNGLSEASFAPAGRQKKLRRLPHIFSKVLELPFRSDADVAVEEDSQSLRFVVATDDVGDDIRAHTIEIYPGVTKLVIRGSAIVDQFPFADFTVDLWRCRLPSSTRPEMATAVCVDGELTVTVPKGGEEEWEEEEGELRGDVGRLVLSF